MTRTIIHLDLDAFFCAVEAQRDPSLHGKPFAVGGSPDARGVVASCSYPARKFGVHSAMPMARAVQLCPDLIIVPGRHHVYGEVSKKVMAHLYNLSHLVETLSIDEAFVDVSDLRPPAIEIAQELQATIWDALRLPCSLGVATNKLVAKIANNIGKASAARSTSGPPRAIKIVPPGYEAAFLAPLPVTELWGVGPKTAASLADLGIATIGDLAAWPERDLTRRFGKHGRALARRARGIDARPVQTEHEVKSISRETTFAHDVTDALKLHRTLCRLSEDVGRRLRDAGLAGSTVKIKLRWSDFTTLTRQVTLAQPTAQDDVIRREAEALLKAAWTRGKPVRLIGVGVTNLGEPHRQLSLWETRDEKGRHLQQALDQVRDRFGSDAIRHAFELDGDEGRSMIDD
jgi:DNA polymerase-4